MLALDASEASLAGAFLLGFSIGIFTALRLFAITFGASVRTLARHRNQIERFDDEQSIDDSPGDEVQRDSEGNPP